MLLSPGHRQLREETERRLLLRDDTGAATPGDRRIDPESGRVVVHRKPPRQPADGPIGR
ncbi:DUF6191 domain-containing protein [Kitasatospora sp. NPDC127111]|uniref:DUF6191 domain-containing protein n=1 Tax=Kitasatospora sp. NPDC127111 TaxID=3345363 RepID=UPI003640078F